VNGKKLAQGRALESEKPDRSTTLKGIQLYGSHSRDRPGHFFMSKLFSLRCNLYTEECKNYKCTFQCIIVGTTTCSLPSVTHSLFHKYKRYSDIKQHRLVLSNLNGIGWYVLLCLPSFAQYRMRVIYVTTCNRSFAWLESISLCALYYSPSILLLKNIWVVSIFKNCYNNAAMSLLYRRVC
jgi:hypothetical protein